MNLLRLVSRQATKFHYKFTTVLAAVAISDFIWAKYMSSVAQGASVVASLWSVLVIALGAYTVVSYVEDKRLVIAACIGAAIGTYLGV